MTSSQAPKGARDAILAAALHEELGLDRESSYSTRAASLARELISLRLLHDTDETISEDYAARIAQILHEIRADEEAQDLASVTILSLSLAVTVLIYQLTHRVGGDPAMWLNGLNQGWAWTDRPY